jgi:ribose transport system ATP-binding protein
MIEAMIGRPLANTARPDTAAQSAGVNPAIRWSSASLDRSFTNVSAEVYPGEVVALFGKLGSGAAEVGETAYGLHHLDAGRLEIEGRPATLSSPAAATHRGVGFLPAERKAGGAFLVRSVAENIAVSSWPLLAKFRLFITSSTEARSYRHWQEKLSIRSRSGPRQLMATLSGGNQQKALIARWLERGSKVLIFLEPTRGVDVGARLEIYRALRELAATGVAILLITSDYEEVVDVADRCYVMAKGRIVAELSSDAVTAGRLLEASGG